MPENPLPQPSVRAPAPSPYGLPADLFRSLWSLDDICRFCNVERDKARQLLAAEGAPPRLRMGSERCHRWNPVQVVTWLHGDDWGSVRRRGADIGPPRFPGAAWAPYGEP